ncbi:hypothetical protein EFT52_05415 [Lacticaseibacillus paracasei]|nr:hypothetical protein [Lacticaseibacillus paracasei]RWZ64806.1 hypothetical protein EQK34_00070 [Lacticaseibacillus paracasei]RWZ67555.1 hypothetical protein EQK34_15835 [Lacticaseibacillus paracasei]
MQTTQRRSLELMLLGDFETGLWARSAVTALATRRHPIWPEIAAFGTAWTVAESFNQCLTFLESAVYSSMKSIPYKRRCKEWRRLVKLLKQQGLA